MEKTDIQEHLELGNRFLKKRFPDAQCAFIAGSLIRGNGTPYSDLDIVVLYHSLTNAYRESFIFEEQRIECFVHDMETLRYFFDELDGKSGRPSLPTIVLEGIAIPLAGVADQTPKELAQSLISKGPAALTQSEINKLSYFITDSVDDIRTPNNRAETTATLAKLYDLLGDFILRTQGRWSAAGKWLPRKLRELDSGLADKFERAFQEGFTSQSTRAVIELCEEVLKPHGGFYFEGFRQDAPKDWRKG